MRGLGKTAAAVALTIGLMTPLAAQAGTDIVNISAVTSTGANPVTYTFNPGTYVIAWAGVAGGGAYDAYNLNCTGGCPSSGWQNNFIAVQQGDPNINLIGLFGQGGGALQYTSAANALTAYQNAANIVVVELAPPYQAANVVGVELNPQPWTLHVDQTGTFNFFIADATRDNNVGGVSLSITSADVPEPGVWGLMIMGFGLAGGMLRRRRTALA
jgi:hypothetical protein